jgi:hypothetical protein
MTPVKIVQFVCFETALNSEEFIKRWENYKRSLNSDLHVTLQQSQKENGMFKYIAQHNSSGDELRFSFTKASRPSRIIQVTIKVKQVGGYLVLQEERKNNTHTNESKIFVFLADANIDLETFRQLSGHADLNIYSAYYENCSYAYVLEFFVKNKYVAELLNELKQYTTEIDIYKECTLPVV